MEKGSQHIVFDTLLALYHKELSLKEVHQYKKHLEACEVCQDLLNGIEAFDTTELLQPQAQFSEKPLEEKLLEIDKQHVRQTRYKVIQRNLSKYFSFLVASMVFIFFFPLNVSNYKIISSQFQATYFVTERGAKKEHNHSYVTDEATKCSDKISASNQEVIILSLLNQLGEIDTNIQAENKVSTPTTKIDNIPKEDNEHFIEQQNSDNYFTEKQIGKVNIPTTTQFFTEKQTPIFSNLSKVTTASGLVKEKTFSVIITELNPENDKVHNGVDKIYLQNKKLIISNLERIKIVEISQKTKTDLADRQTIVTMPHYDEPLNLVPVTPKFYARYGLSHMKSAVSNKDEIPLTQRIQSDTLIGSKISEYLVDAHSNTTGLDLAFGYQLNRHVGFELGTSYTYSRENLIDEEATNGNYDRLYVTNRRFILSPALMLEAGGRKLRPFARLGLVIPVAGQTQRRRVSNEAELVHSFISFVNLDANIKSANANFESNSIIKWRSSLGYNLALGLSYQFNDVFEVFGMAGYTGLRINGKTYETHHADLITGDGGRTNILPIIHALQLNVREDYVNESANFSTVNFSMGTRFNF